MAFLVYVLCTLTSLWCAILLLRSYTQTKTRVLLWSSLCFIGLAANNVFLFLDFVVVQGIDLSGIRTLLALISLSVLLFGLIWDAT